MGSAKEKGWFLDEASRLDTLSVVAGLALLHSGLRRPVYFELEGKSGDRMKDAKAIQLSLGEGVRVVGPWGRSIVLKAGGRETENHYSLLEFTAAPGTPWSTYHTHPTTEAWYVLEGELNFRLGGDLFTARAGSFVLAPGGTPHAAANVGSVAARYLVMFSPAGLERWFVDLADLVEAARPGEPSPSALSALAERYGIVAVE